MKTETAGERKRTVTVTIGPRTLHGLQDWQKAVEKVNPGLDIPLTAIASAAMLAGLKEWMRDHGMTLDRGWTNTVE